MNNEPGPGKKDVGSLVFNLIFNLFIALGKGELMNKIYYYYINRYNENFNLIINILKVNSKNLIFMKYFY